MALSEDQKAMLRLLAQREEGYDDMAALMGISVEEVRERVKEALAEVDEAGSSAEQVPEPPLASTPPPLQPQAEETPPATPPTPEPPTAPLAPVASPSVKAPTSRRRPFKRPSPPAGPRLPKDRGALIGLGAGAAVVVILVVVLIVGGGGGGSNSTTAASIPSTAAGEGTNAAATGGNSSLTQAILSPANGGAASGQALFGRYKKNVLIQVEAEGLDPAPAGQSYNVWLYRSPKVALRVGSVPVEKSGKVAAQLPIPAQLLAYVANGAFDQVDLSLTSNSSYKAAVAKAKSEKTLPPYTGESILRGQITGPSINSQ